MKTKLVGVYKKKIVGVFLENFSLRKKKGIDVEIEYGRCKAVSNIRHAHKTQEKKRKKGGVEGMDAVMEYGRCKTEKKTQKKTQTNQKIRDRCGDGVWALQDGDQRPAFVANTNKGLRRDAR